MMTSQERKPLVRQSGRRQKPIIVGMSVGNPYFYNNDNLYRLFTFADQHSQRVKLFITDAIGVHNYRAVFSSNPERAAQTKANRLRNKCNTVLTKHPELQPAKFTYTDWRKEVEEASAYQKQLKYIMDLFENEPEFRQDVLDSTESALKSLIRGRRKEGLSKTSSACINKENVSHPGTPNVLMTAAGGGDNGEGRCSDDQKAVATIEEAEYDKIEGSNYLLKELAFFLAIPGIYEHFEEYVLVYHREWPLLEKLFAGQYDGVPKPCLEFLLHN